MTREELERCERELLPLVPGQGASSFAVEDARAFNASLSDLREAVLAPYRGMVEKGRASPELGACVLRTVAELAFWRRVLVGLHRDELRVAAGSPDFLLRYLLS